MMKGEMGRIVLAFAIFSVLGMTGCASNQRINLKIHSEPEGAHVIYRLDNNSWTYLGVTPLDTIEVIHEENLEGNHTFSLKAMRCGYLDQVKKWHGDQLLEENEAKGMIFWTPRLIRNEE